MLIYLFSIRDTPGNGNIFRNIQYIRWCSIKFFLFNFLFFNFSLIGTDHCPIIRLPCYYVEENLHLNDSPQSYSFFYVPGTSFLIFWKLLWMYIFGKRAILYRCNFSKYFKILRRKNIVHKFGQLVWKKKSAYSSKQNAKITLWKLSISINILHMETSCPWSIFMNLWPPHPLSFIYMY